MKYFKIDRRLKGATKDFIDEPILITVNDFTEETTRKFRDQMSKAHELQQPIIPILIDSRGGEAYALMAMISCIKRSSIPVATIIDGKAMSAGAVLFTYGSERWIADDAVMMIHDVLGWAGGKVGEMESRTEEAKRLAKVVYRKMAANCGQPAEYFNDLVHDHGRADLYLTARQAKRHNLATRIGVPSLVTQISVQITLE